MRLCIITSSYPMHPDDGEAAAGVFVREIALALSRKGVDVTVMTQDRPGESRDDREISVVRFPWSGQGRRLSTLSLSRPRDFMNTVSLMLSGWRCLARLVRERRFDAILAAWAVPAGAWARLARLRFGVPYVTWALGSDIWVYGRKALTRRLVGNILRGAKAVFADGNDLREETERVGGRKCEFLPTTRILPKDNLPRPRLLEGKTHFLFVGRFHSHKGIDVLIEAIKRLPPDRIAGMHFHVFGGGDMAPAIERSIEAYGLGDRVTLGGYIPATTVAGYLADVHAMIIPSRIESIPLVLSDALQMGCPIIVTDVGDMGLLVGGHNAGIVVPPEDPAALAEAISKMAATPRQAFASGIRSLYGLFDVERMSDTLMDTFAARQAE